MKRDVAAIALVVCSLVACTRGAGPARARGDVLRVALTTEPKSLSPLFALDDYEQFVDRLLFDVLVSVDVDGRTLLPRLAETVPTVANGGISRDGRTLTYRLRRGVRWHDGAPFTSRDVVFSFGALMNPANDVPNRQGYDRVSRVDAPNAYTVVFHLKQPYAPAVTELFSDAAPNPILPAHLLAGERDLNRAAFNAAPVGTGPFRFVRWNRGDSLELARNDAYYGGRPHVARLSVHFVPDESTIVDELRTGELDLFVEGSVTAYGQVRRLARIRTTLTSIHGASTLTMNLAHPILRDVRVRRAIAMAIDRRAIVERFTFGAATPATEDLPSFMWAFDPSAAPPPFDPAGARGLLRSAGWIPGADGIATKAGTPLRLVLAFAQNNATARVVAVAVQSELRTVGVDAEVKGYTTSMLFAPYGAGGVYRRGSFDLAWYTMTLGIDPSSASRFSCAAVPPSGQNYSRYCNPEMDVAQRDGLRRNDEAGRREAYARSQHLLARDVPIVFVYWPMDVAAFRDGVRGFAPNPVTPSWNAERWSLASEAMR